METATKRLYEGMFLVDSAQAAADWDDTLAVIENILKRADAEVVAMRKWGERRLAYDIDHKSRGTYILSYFKVEGPRIAGIEKDVQLSEKVMRVLVLGTEKRPPEMIEADMTGVSPEEKEAAEKEAAEAATEKPATETTPAEAKEAPQESAPKAEESAPAESTSAETKEAPQEPAPKAEESAPAESATDGDQAQPAEPQADAEEPEKA